jgi:hypothetical protein
MGLDTKAYWLTDRQSPCDFDFELLVESVESCICENLVAEAMKSSGNNRKENVRRCKPLPSNG